MTDEELAVARGFVDGNLPTGLDGRAVVDLVRRLLDEVKRRRGELAAAANTITAPAVQLAEIGAMVGYPDPPLIVETVRAELDRARTECTALTAKAKAARQGLADNLAEYEQVIASFGPSKTMCREEEEHRDLARAETAEARNCLAIFDAAMGSGMPHTPAQGCTCHPTDPSTWTRYGDAVEPGSMWEPDPACPEHGAHTEILPAQEGRGDAETAETGSGRGTGVRESHARPQAVVWGQGANCPHRPEWHCETHGECRGCECGCDTVNPEVNEDDAIPSPVPVEEGASDA